MVLFINDFSPDNLTKYERSEAVHHTIPPNFAKVFSSTKKKKPLNGYSTLVVYGFTYYLCRSSIIRTTKSRNRKTACYDDDLFNVML